VWRQGQLLSDEAVSAIGLRHPEFPDDTLVIMATHPCDLAQLPDKEPQVEIIIGRRIDRLDGNNTHAKSSRTLHVNLQATILYWPSLLLLKNDFLPRPFWPTLSLKRDFIFLQQASTHFKSGWPPDIVDLLSLTNLSEG